MYGMTIEQKGKWEKFLNLFCSSVKKLTKSDGLKSWQNFVNNSDFETVMKTVSDFGKELSEARKSNQFVKAPMLPDFISKYQLNLRAKTGVVKDGQACNICDGTGYVAIVENTKNGTVLDCKNPPVGGMDNNWGVTWSRCSCTGLARNNVRQFNFGVNDRLAMQWLNHCQQIYSENQKKKKSEDYNKIN